MNKGISTKLWTSLICLVLQSAATAELIAGETWTGWTIISNEDDVIDFGGGGQTFDAEYLLYKYDANSGSLSIGLQTGFDISSGYQPHNGKNYWAGDIALSFDADSSAYEFAIDFGLQNCGFSQRNNSSCGTADQQGLNDAAGIYQSVNWNNDIHPNHLVSSPFAMETGSLLIDLATGNNMAGSATAGGEMSFYRQITFDLAELNIGQVTAFDAHWTMSSGNDAINGSASISQVPIPAAGYLFTSALLGLGLTRLGRRK